MSNLNTNFDNNDFDTFLNLDNDFTPVSASPAHHVPTLAHHSSASSSSTLASSQPSFSGPSYEYGSHRQQTGLPMGGLANTFAVNQASGLHYRPGNMGFVMPTETLNLPLSNLDDFDFGRSQLDMNDMNDMEFDADSPSDLPTIFYPSGSTPIKSEPSQSAPIQRIYPGMHSQQAAQAKQRQDVLRQQQQQQPKQLSGQLPLPTQAPKAAKDPHVEESISRLLSRMRQSSTSSIDDAASAADGMSGVARTKKEEDDMDEDERLLASEEGKKLSSKERRQLRNKVSARAFRSRRKEYIGQLEGEVAGKAQEANELRAQNRQLMEENARLTDLTRMLLSSQAFSGFLQELSNSGMSMPSITSRQQPQQAQQPQQQTRKDVAAHEANRQLKNQNQQHVGMTMVPETNFDVTDFSNNWTVPLPSNDFQVFSVTSMPEPPTLDLSALSEKETSSILSAPRTTKKDVPELSFLPPPIDEVTSANVEPTTPDATIEEDTTDLYSACTISKPTTQSAASLLKSLAKPTTAPEVAVTHENASDLASHLDHMCSLLEESYERLENYLP